jgi:hypothetical protein
MDPCNRASFSTTYLTAPEKPYRPMSTNDAVIPTFGARFPETVRQVQLSIIPQQESHPKRLA